MEEMNVCCMNLHLDVCCQEWLYVFSLIACKWNILSPPPSNPDAPCTGTRIVHVNPNCQHQPGKILENHSPIVTPNTLMRPDVASDPSYPPHLHFEKTPVKFGPSDRPQTAKEKHRRLSLLVQQRPNRHKGQKVPRFSRALLVCHVKLY